MRRTLATLVFWCSAAAASAAPGPDRPPPGAAAAPGVPPGSARTVVMMAARLQEKAAQEFHRAVGAQLSDAPVTLTQHWVESLGKDLRAELLQARRLARAPGVAVVFWCDLSGSDDVYLYLAEPGGGRLLVRAVPQGAPSARAESLAIIVGASVRAFLQASAQRATGGTASRPSSGPGESPPRGGAAAPGGARTSAEGPPAVGDSGSRSRAASEAARRLALTGPGDFRPPPGLVGVARPRRPPRLSLELGYTVDSYNQDNAPLHGARLALGWHLGRHFTIMASYRVLQAVVGRLEGAEVGLQRNPLSLGGEFRLRLGRFTIGGAAALVADYVSITARASLGSPALLERSGSQGDWNLLASVGLVGGLEVVDRLWLVLSVGVDFVLYSKGYMVRVPDAGGLREEVILRPWIAQPYGVLGLRFEVL